MLHTLTPRQATVTHMYDRLWQLMDAHRLSLTNVATLLADINMGVSVLESRERKLDYLTTPVIGHIAALFCVSPDWLEGTGDHPVRPVMLTHCSEVADPLFSASEVTAPTINLVRWESNPPMYGTISHKDDIIFCISRLNKINGINLRVIDFTGVMRNTKIENKGTDAFLAFCETVALLNKSNIWPARGSDHSPSIKIATFRGPAKVQHHQLEGLQQRPYHSGFTHLLGG